jgi:5-methylcytosine-specific restriction protein A
MPTRPLRNTQIDRASLAPIKVQRLSAHQRGYGARWRKHRKIFLANHPVCSDPYHRHPNQIRPATDDDHIIAKRRGGKDGEENEQALCHSCHSYKTRLEMAGAI